jgi:hypothetical protein
MVVMINLMEAESLATKIVLACKTDVPGKTTALGPHYENVAPTRIGESGYASFHVVPKYTLGKGRIVDKAIVSRQVKRSVDGKFHGAGDSGDSAKPTENLARLQTLALKIKRITWTRKGRLG